MRRIFKLIQLTASIGLLTLIIGCKKESKSLPELTTLTVTGVTTNKAQSGGAIVSEGGSSITQRGVCWGKTQLPTIANNKTIENSGETIFYSTITGLSENTTYYVRAYATNDEGTTYGDQKIFTTSDANSTVTDIDGNVYNIITIGSQVWMLENLRTIHYRNGDLIPNVTNNLSWGPLTSGAYCNYKNDTAMGAVYGRLYNFYAVVDSRNISPAGWHVPTSEEWAILYNYLGGDSIAGNKMRETGTVHWKAPNTGATNASGFIGLPGGFRDHAGGYTDMAYYGYWWTASQFDFTYAWYQYLGFNYNYLGTRINGKEMGYSIRCVKDVTP